MAVRSHAVGDEVEVTYVRDGKEQTTKVTLGSDEELQAKQEEEQRQQQEEYERQMKEYEQYMNERNNQQTWPWDTYNSPWELWDWDMDTMGNPGMMNE